MVGMAELMADLEALAATAQTPEEGLHTPDATNAKVRISTGWGQSLVMHDKGSQSSPSAQYIELANSDKTAPLHNFVRMEQVAQDRMFMIRAAGFQLNIVENNHMRVVKNGSEFIWLQKGNLIRNTAGSEIRYNNIGLYISKNLHVLQVGQRPIHNVVITKQPWHCPWTGMVHWPRFASQVFASE